MSAPATMGARGRMAYLPLTFVAIVTVFPFFAMIMLAFKPSNMTLPKALLPESFTLENFSQIASSSTNILRWGLNSLIYASVSVALVLLICSLAGYAFAKKRFPGRTLVFWAFIATLMVPFQVTLIPLFILTADLHWVNTYQGMIAPTLANATGVFIMRQFIAGLPDQLLDAAKLDGASELRIFFGIVLPLIRPALTTLGVFVFLWHWNDLLWPLVVAQSENMRTLTVGLATFQLTNPQLGPLMATATVTFIPGVLVFVVFQRYYVQGIAQAGLKG